MLLNGITAQYRHTHNPAHPQNILGNRKISCKETSSSLIASAKPVLSLILLSSTILQMLARKLKIQRNTPSQQAATTPQWPAAHGERTSLSTEPPLAIDKFRPSANATSLPLNRRKSK